MNKKHYLVIAVSLIIVGVLAGLCIRSYDNYQYEQQIKAQVQAAQTAERVKKNQEVQAEIERRRTECNKKISEYLALPKATKATVAPPTCNLAPIQ